MSKKLTRYLNWIGVPTKGSAQHETKACLPSLCPNFKILKSSLLTFQITVETCEVVSSTFLSYMGATFSFLVQYIVVYNLHI